MKLTVINSNSAGNAYILHNEKEALLIECGVHFARIQQALGHNVGKVAGCLVTHEHKDHCKAVNEVLNKGICVYASAGTHRAMGTEGHHRHRKLEVEREVMLRSFKVIAYDAMHDCAEPFCYTIYHKDCGWILFLTDSYYCDRKFNGLNNIIIEANYCQTIVDNRVREGKTEKFLRDRVLESHMSLDTCKKTLQSYDLSKVNNIVLIHLSDGNSDEARFKREVQEATGKVVHVANAGLTIDFNRQPF
jgi:phosphoribosyl 1,2-cyclic phosphodiesterase